MVRLVNRRREFDSGSNPLRLSFRPKRLVDGHCPVTVPLTINETYIMAPYTAARLNAEIIVVLTASAGLCAVGSPLLRDDPALRN